MSSSNSVRARSAAAIAASLALSGLALLATGVPAAAEVCNIKVVTDGNPDYSDIGSMIHSTTSGWKTDKDKCWAVWYWNHIARRQTAPMILHGRELTDPIRQFNDYGYMMCSTIAGSNCAIYGAMGYKVRFWDISLHTVVDVEYDGKYHMYDGSLSALYTTCDGSRLADVTEIGADGACEESGGKTEPGHIAKYHCLAATSDNGFLTGCDTIRSLAQEYKCFNPRGLKYRYYLNNWSLGHRYVLNLRDDEVYTRHYHRMDAESPYAVRQIERRPGYKADPAYFVPNKKGNDPEAVNPRYGIRGNGLRTWKAVLSADWLGRNTRSMSGVKAAGGAVAPAKAGQTGEVVFKVEGSNVITSMTLLAALQRKTADDVAAVSISTTNGLTWKDVFKPDETGEIPTEIKLRDEVNGAYEVLVKVKLLGKATASDAQLKGLSFQTITMLNSKTQPRLRLGRNTVYVGTGEQTESIVFWPDLHGDAWKPYVVDQQNAKIADDPKPYLGSLQAAEGGKAAYVVFRMDAPGDITKITYGGRFYNRGQGARTDLLHSFDGGKTWKKSWSLTDRTSPWDVLHYETVNDVPAGTRSVLYKYQWESVKAGKAICSIYAVRMEAHHKTADASFKPIEVTYTWKERQEDYSTVTRSHTQLVEKVPFTYTINVGGADHPVMESIRTNLQGAAGKVTCGYSDGKDVGGEKFQDRWVTYGKILSTGKPYTCSEKSMKQHGAGDPKGKVLTDGVVGSTYVGGISYRSGALYDRKQRPEITVDLEKPQTCGAFRIHLGGYPWWDALKGQVKDTIEVLTSVDGKEFTSQGFFNVKLRWKDLPANYVWPDDEKLCGPNYELIPPKPVQARHVRFKVTPARTVSITEVQVLESIKYEPFDLKVALPDGTDRSDVSKYNPKHTPSRPYKPGR